MSAVVQPASAFIVILSGLRCKRLSEPAAPTLIFIGTRGLSGDAGPLTAAWCGPSDMNMLRASGKTVSAHPADELTPIFCNVFSHYASRDIAVRSSGQE